MENRKIIIDDNATRVELVSVNLLNTITTGMVLDATYRIYNNNGSIDEVCFPRIALPFHTNRLPIMQCGFYDDAIDADFGFGETTLLPDENQQIYVFKQIKPANAVEMTLDDIEKKLGHPVKIVKEK